MHFTKALLVSFAAFAPLALAEDTAITTTITVQSVGAQTSSATATPTSTVLSTSSASITPSSTASPTPTPYWRASSSSIRVSSTPASSATPATSSVVPFTGAAAPAVKFPGMMAGGALAVAGLAMF